MTHSKRFAQAVVLGALVTSGAHVLAQTPRFRQEVTVRSLAPAGDSDFFLTFSGPVALPGVSLGTGTYLFSRRGHGVISVSSADHGRPYAMIHTIPTDRANVTDQHAIVFGDPLVSGAPRRIVAWFLPGQRRGHELIYPTR